jgi:hypothetical protein
MKWLSIFTSDTFGRFSRRKRPQADSSRDEFNTRERRT